MVEMSDTISFIEKLAERRSQLILRAEEAKTESERQHWLEVAEQLQIMIGSTPPGCSLKPGSKRAILSSLQCNPWGRTGPRILDFINRGNVVDLAVAVIIGAAFTKVVQAMVELFTTAALNPTMAELGLVIDCWPAEAHSAC